MSKTEVDFNVELEALGDISKPLTMRGLKTLSNLDDGQIATLWDQWQQIPGERRLEIVQALNQLAEDNIDLDFRQLLLTLLDDRDSAVRAAAINGLWEDERSWTLHRLFDLLHDPTGEVRAAATLGLSRFAYRAEVGELPEDDAQKVCTVLLELAGDPEQPLEVRRRAVEGLGYFCNSQESQVEIGRAYAHPEQLMRESAIAAMGRSMRSVWFPYIVRELHSISPALRYEAARAVGELGEEGQQLVSPLLPLVDDEDVEVSQAAIWALGQVGGPHAQRVLQRLARSRDDARRQAALEALDELTFDDF
ncbi:MAG: HEAT repeat domain-containing protein [Chloroflexales bacterium]|nr:HEAT repeat domain-containing protein [Chloroflexales bacterium]